MKTFALLLFLALVSPSALAGSSYVICGQSESLNDDYTKPTNAAKSLNLQIEQAAARGYTEVSAPSLGQSANRGTSVCVTVSLPKK